METQNKTTLDIIQELIAIYTTRQDVVEKLTSKASKEATGFMSDAKHQSEHFISELMGELSAFGDGVQDSPDRDNEYQQLWKAKLSSLDSLNAEQASGLFSELENKLGSIYTDILSNKDLPDSLRQILLLQQAQIVV